MTGTTDAYELPVPGVCPHCKSLDMDPGATGLDECNACGGLSRNGKRLKTAQEAADDAFKALASLREHQTAQAARLAALEALARRLIDYETDPDGRPSPAGLAREAREALGE